MSPQLLEKVFGFDHLFDYVNALPVTNAPIPWIKYKIIIILDRTHMYFFLYK